MSSHLFLIVDMRHWNTDKMTEHLHVHISYKSTVHLKQDFLIFPFDSSKIYPSILIVFSFLVISNFQASSNFSFVRHSALYQFTYSRFHLSITYSLSSCLLKFLDYISCFKLSPSQFSSLIIPWSLVALQFSLQQR